MLLYSCFRCDVPYVIGGGGRDDYLVFKCTMEKVVINIIVIRIIELHKSKFMR